MKPLDEKALEPCPFCGKRLVEAHSFATRTTKTFVHPVDGDDPCAARGLRVVSDSPDSIAAWNRRAYMAALDPAPGWLVKPLEWKLVEDDWWAAETIIGPYEVRQARLSVRVRFPDRRLFRDFDDTLAAAFSAVQSDYEARIRSVILPAAPMSQER